MGFLELEKGLKWWVSGAKKWSETGGLEVIPVLLSNLSPPPPACTFSAVGLC